MALVIRIHNLVQAPRTRVRSPKTTKKMNQQGRMFTLYVSLVLVAIATLSVSFRSFYSRIDDPSWMECTVEKKYTVTLAAAFFAVCLVAFAFGGFVGYVIAISGWITVNERVAMLKSQYSRLSAKRILNINDCIVFHHGENSMPPSVNTVCEDINRLIVAPSWEAINASCSKLGESHHERALTVQPREAVSGRLTGDEAEDSPCMRKSERWLSVRDRINLFETMIKNGATRTEVRTRQVEPRKRKKENWVKSVLDRLQGFSSAFDAMFEDNDKSVASPFPSCRDHRYKIGVPIAKFWCGP